MKALVISPTYNEKNNIAELISLISKIKYSLDILIIDDNSPDGTADIVKKIKKKNDNIYIIERKYKMGLGTAYCAGFQWAIEREYDIIIQMDADLSHNPSDIPRLIDETNKHDLIIGSRYIKGVNVVNWPIRRLLLSYFANTYARLFIGLKINDLTGGYKCFKREVLCAIELENIKSQGYSFQIEINFLAWIKGFKIKEIPIVFTDRTIGESKMNRGIVIEAILMVPKLLIRKLFKIN